MNVGDLLDPVFPRNMNEPQCPFCGETKHNENGFFCGMNGTWRGYQVFVTQICKNHKPDQKPTPVCTCDLFTVLMVTGCRCGALAKEKEYKAITCSM